MVRSNSNGDAKAIVQRIGSNGTADVFGEPAAMISGETIGQLMQLQSGFLELRELRERERASSQKLVELLRNAMHELDITIPLSNGVLSSVFANVHEGWLSPDSTVVVSDSSGSKKSISLQELPPHTIAAILQESAIRMNEALSQKLDSVGRSIDLLEKAVHELGSTTKPAGRGVSPPAEPQVLVKPSELANVSEPTPKTGAIETKGKPSEEDVKRFSFTGIFK